ncbi:serine carboxypeptidase-like 51 [Camellia sinensis]|uniref:serine carboxypeptidase-like 51 n=1 Tax=Camellia sinensis TaxID=4442 RepID=UPI001035D91C|nr:serine carboxypeptidase-like 51 [Camellia sinensis]
MASMKSLVLLEHLSLLVSNSLVLANFHLTVGTDDGSEQWGYVEVRPKAHMFWWLYRSPHRVEDPSNPWPTILWLQGGPGGSGVGFGNFLEIGPLDVDLKPRNSTWLTKADLLFVDSPVGTGFSYVEDESLAVKTDEAAAIDLTAMLKALFNGNETLQKSPLFIIAESYGGKFAVTLGLSALKAIEAEELKLQLGVLFSTLDLDDFAEAIKTVYDFSAQIRSDQQQIKRNLGL